MTDEKPRGSLLAGRGGEEPLRTGEPLGSVPRGRLPQKTCPVTSRRQRDSRSSRRHTPGGPRTARLLHPLLVLRPAWYRGAATWPSGPQFPALENGVMTAILGNHSTLAALQRERIWEPGWGLETPPQRASHCLDERPRVGSRQVGGASPSIFNFEKFQTTREVS